MTIYIKATKKVKINSKREVSIGDIAELVGPASMIDQIKTLKVLDIQSSKKGNYIVSILDVIKKVEENDWDMVINSVGESDIIIEYDPNPKENLIWTWIKILFVCMTVFTGSAIAIMTFHTDAALPDVFKELYGMFMGEETDKPYLIQIPYSIGLAVGIIVFFNHFSSKKITDDPTPIEVEMNLYEKDVDDCLIDTLSQQKKG